MAFDKMLSLHFSHLENGVKKRIYLIGLFRPVVLDFQHGREIQIPGPRPRWGYSCWPGTAS
jgi:hypothetical protein